MFNPEQKFEEGFEEGREKTPQLKPITQEEFEKALNREKEEMGSMKELITQAIEESLGGSRVVKITFRPGAMSEVQHLLNMASSRKVQIDNNDQRILMSAVNDGRWEAGRRTIKIELMNNFDEKLFTRQLGDAIEKIEAID